MEAGAVDGQHREVAELAELDRDGAGQGVLGQVEDVQAGEVAEGGVEVATDAGAGELELSYPLLGAAGAGDAGEVADGGGVEPVRECLFWVARDALLEGEEGGLVAEEGVDAMAGSWRNGYGGEERQYEEVAWLHDHLPSACMGSNFNYFNCQTGWRISTLSLLIFDCHGFY